MPESHEGYRSRLQFISRLAGGFASVSALAACGGGASGLLVPSGGALSSARRTLGITLRDTPEYQALMRKYNFLAVVEGAHAVIRDDMKTEHDFIAHISKRRRPFDDICPQVRFAPQSTGSGNCPTDSSELAFTNLPQLGDGTSSEIFWGDGGGYTDYSSLLDWPPGPLVYKGPWWSIPRALACQNMSTYKVVHQFTNLAEAMIAGLIVNGKNWIATGALLRAAKAFLAGSISLPAFLDVIFACVSASDLPFLLAAAGVTIQIDTMWNFVVCEYTGQPPQ